jgi:hypothetical protein
VSSPIVLVLVIVLVLGLRLQVGFPGFGWRRSKSDNEDEDDHDWEDYAHDWSRVPRRGRSLALPFSLQLSAAEGTLLLEAEVNHFPGPQT